MGYLGAPGTRFYQEPLDPTFFYISALRLFTSLSSELAITNQSQSYQSFEIDSSDDKFFIAFVIIKAWIKKDNQRFFI